MSTTNTLNALTSMSSGILLADRDPTLAEMVRQTLVSRGQAIRICTSGLQCLEELKKLSPSVLVVDLELLWGGGAGVIDWLADDESFLPPMVAVASDPNCRALPDHLEAWVDVHIQRPESPDQILPFINQLETLAWWARSPLRNESPARSKSMVSNGSSTRSA